MNWVEKQLGDLIELFNSKRIPLNSIERKRRQGNFPYYGAQSIVDYIDDYIFDGEYILVAEDGENLNTRKAPIANFVKGKFWVNNHAHILKAKKGKSTDFFIMYFLNTCSISGFITGAAQPKLSKTNLLKIPIKIPDYNIQVMITSIGLNYDKLIENNTKRIEILEEMAQRIYKEWFVDFKYPGHENDNLVDSELGMIPEGWEISDIKDVVNKVVLGGTPARKNEKFWSGEIPWIKSGKLNDLRVLEGTEYITQLGLEKSATKLMPRRTVLIAITGAIIISLSEIELCANQSVIGLYDSPLLSQEYIYLNQQINIHQYISKMSGSAQQHINKDIVQNTKILVPSINILNDFDKLIKPLFNQVSSLLFKNKNLTSTRDYLLPKLISGKVDVSDLDIDTDIIN